MQAAARAAVAVTGALVLACAACGGSEGTERFGAFDSAWSPDARELAATIVPRPWDCSDGGPLCTEFDGARSELWILGLAAGDRRRIADGAEPAWSPDGRRIAYVPRSSGPEPGGVAVVDADGRNRRELAGRGAGDPVWSPDGRTLAFRRSDAERRTAELWTIGVDGSGERRLGTVAAFTAGDGSREDRPYRWSPGSGTIAFAVEDPLGDDEASTALYSVRADGTGRRRISSRRVAAFTFAWSPTGRWLAFAACCSGRGARGLYVTRPDGSEERLIARGDIGSFSWSPDGRAVAFAEWRRSSDLASGGGFSLGVVTLDGARLRMHERLQAEPPDPSWSPDGRSLAFAAGGIHVARGDGGGRRRLAADGVSPQWSADGKRIAFLRDYELYAVGADGRGLRRLSP